MQSAIMSLGRLPVDEVEFVLMDPKRVELSAFEDDSHTAVYCDDAKDILSTLIKYCEEMENRYKIFKKHKVRSLEQYRAKVKKDIPYSILFIDEFGDLIMQKSELAKEVKDCMIRLGQKARAAGIHLVIGTQRPSAKVVDGLIKANFPVRVAFRTSSRTDSEIVMDRSGAELLLGKGDMLLSVSGKVERLQGYNI